MEAQCHCLTAADVCKFTEGQINKFARTTKAWGELSQPQRIEISRLGQLQDLQMLLKDLLPLLNDINAKQLNQI